MEELGNSEVHFVQVTNLNRRDRVHRLARRYYQINNCQEGPNLPNFEPRFKLMPAYQTRVCHP
ncbi:hypothetical protein WN51_05237 [Melipona quadrifasciata]|uniref:Uncharacterized protein n=1 Tax=Melipona quadrifasciata TaxID=166423 RepID=A0A0M8ZSW7_9HYME|nr:hypothetical protein WN51_05237 [Melipona quadrifasciata]